jgi:hypothetical protein
MMANGDPDGLVQWAYLFVPTVLGGIGAFFHLKGDVRVVKSNVTALEDRMDLQYKAILRELTDIKNLIDR